MGRNNNDQKLLNFMKNNLHMQAAQQTQRYPPKHIKIKLPKDRKS